MGMDVYGKKPATKDGEYFRNNVWWWHPLWDYCQHVAPRLMGQINGHTNDGEGLGPDDARMLATILEDEIIAGRTQEYAMIYQKAMAKMPSEACTLCMGSGVRKDMKLPQGGCNGCQGKGMVRPFITSYRFSVDNVRDFVKFLRDCGGFEIL